MWMRENHVKKHLHDGLPSVGTWLSIPSPFVAEYMAQIGFEWLVVDTEHNPISIETTAAMFLAMANSGTAPMVRIPWNSGENIKRVLDAGAWGIVVPMVNSRAEAELAVSSALYPPAGVRSVGGGRHTISLLDDGTPGYQERANEHVAVIVQAEHVLAVERADEILSVPGIDACFIGPNDLMASMGMRPQLESDHPRVVEAIEHIRLTCQKYGVASGIHTYGHESASRRIREGFQFIALASELRFMLGGSKAELALVETGRTLAPVGASGPRY